MNERVALVTLSFVESAFPVATSVAVIVAVPAVNAVACPVAGSMLATARSEEIQVTDDVFTTDVLSEFFPVATNCNSSPFAILGLTGVTDRDERVAAVTVNVVDAAVPVAGSMAVIVVFPTDNAVATP